jgi:GntR family transcriptional regulator
VNTPAYRRLADTLRTAIQTGTYQPGDTLPKLTDLMAEHHVSKTTVAEAIGVLEREGLVSVARRRGTVVLAAPVRQRLTRARQVFRDEIGYYFDPTAQPWRPLETPTRWWGTAPAEIERTLGETDVLHRDRLMGDPATRRPTQLATSYLPGSIARGTVLEEADTGPGGIYDRLEEMGHGPLRWSEAVSARRATEEELARLKLAKGTPLLRIVRTTTSPAGLVLEINDTRMSADDFEIGYPLTRDESASV